ncbi:MAG: hypothetical protein KKB31_04660 [Nanoarchaeota archaeon]|nr:hypothetical protein [Nanoarchaeota archaeon]
MNILALDLATKTGWCFKKDGKILSGTQDFSLRRGESHGLIFLRFRKWLAEFLIPGEKVFVCHEQSHHRGGAATALLGGLIAETQAFAAEHGFEIMPVHSATLKKFATGSGRADKAVMIQKAKDQGYNPQDDNEADAIHLLRYAIQEVGQ